MHALIDCDVLVYEMASLKDDEGYPITWGLLQGLIDKHLDGIIDAVDADTWQGYLTGKGNFRNDIATIRPYKGGRDHSNRPFWFSAVYNYLRDNRGSTVVDGMEADDAIAIQHNLSGGNTVLCSRDKDLRQVAGWHYNWPFGKKQELRDPFWISEIDGLRNFYIQLLTGDSTDNIPGLFGVGPRAASVLRTENYSSELEMFREVKEQYELRFGSYWDMFMAENGRLLWLLRHEEDDWYDRQRWLTNELDSMP